MTDTAARLPFLLEVGTDELPARFQPVEIEHVQRGVAALLTDAELACEGLRVLASASWARERPRHFLTMSLPNHFVEIAAAEPSRFMSSIAVCSLAISAVSSLRVPTP